MVEPVDLMKMKLKAVLTESFRETWDHRRPARFEIVEHGEMVGIRFWVQDRDGKEHGVYEEPPQLVHTEEDVAQVVSKALSTFLMLHPTWPR